MLGGCSQAPFEQPAELLQVMHSRASYDMQSELLVASDWFCSSEDFIRWDSASRPVEDIQLKMLPTRLRMLRVKGGQDAVFVDASQVFRQCTRLAVQNLVQHLMHPWHISESCTESKKADVPLQGAAA